MQDESTAEYGGNSTESLRNVSHSVIHIKVRTLSVDSTGVYELPEPFDEVLHFETLLDMMLNRISVTVLVVADYVSDEVHDLLILFCYLLQQFNKTLFQVVVEVLKQLLTHLTEPFVKLFCRIMIFFYVGVFLEQFNKRVKGSQEGFLLHETESFGLEYFSL